MAIALIVSIGVTSTFAATTPSTPPVSKSSPSTQAPVMVTPKASKKEDKETKDDVKKTPKKSVKKTPGKSSHK